MFIEGDTYYFTGTLTGGKRDIHWSCKTLLTNIMCDGVMFRDHCWISPSRRVSRLLPMSHHKHKVKIAFSARVEKYMSSHGEKLGLRHIRNIMVLKENNED